MSEWKEIELLELTEPIKETYNPTGSDNHKYIGLEHIEQDSLRLNGVGNSNDVTSNKFQFKANDVLFGKLRVYFRKVVKPNFDGICSTDIWVFRAKEGYNQNFLYYFLANRDFINLADGGEGGTRMPRADWNFLKATKWNLPPLPEQRAIAGVLSSLDDKIDLLHRQNTILEKMAETLFRQWFVEEAKEEWKDVKLENIVDVVNGVSYKSDDLNPSKTAMITLKSFNRDGGFRMDGFKEYTGKYKDQHILKEGDLVVAHTDITQEAEVIGNPVMVIGNPIYETLVFSMDLVKVIPKNEYFSNEFLYLLMKSREFKGHCLGYSNGSTVLHLSKKAIPEYELKLPPNKVINEFSLKVKPLIKKQFINQTQISTLTQLRDTLLPKLMSGEVRIE